MNPIRKKIAVGLFRNRAQRLIALSLTTSLAITGTAYGIVSIDDTDLVEGENSVGGGTATYGDSLLDMIDVTADKLTCDEDLTINFNGSNDIEHTQVTGDANVTLNFNGDNEVEDIEAYDNSDLTVNVNEHNDFEDIEAYDSSKLTVKVNGEAEVEAIKGYDDASVTVTGTNCPRKDVLELGEGEDSERIGTERGALTIRRSDVDMTKPEGEDSPYRIWSKTGIELIEEKNGEVKEGTLNGVKVHFVDTGDGEDVHLKSALTPCYYRSCDDNKELPKTGGKVLAKTGDASGIVSALALLAAGMTSVAAGFFSKRLMD